MKKRISSFLAGAGVALALSACLTTAMAAAGKVTYNFSNVALDGTLKITADQDITAANGQKVPSAILYTDEAGGKTNYLPIRTISELLGVEIGYDSATKTVLLGEHPAAPVSAASESSQVPQNPKMGDKELIVKRGGTLLPDDDPNSYSGDEKLFKDENGELRAEWMVGNEDSLQASSQKLLKTLQNGDYPKNSKGESYGSELLAEYVGYNPDLRHLAAYPPEGRPEGYYRESDMAALPKNLPESECTHDYTIPLYDSEGNVIGEYKVGCSGHYETSGMTLEEAREVIIKAGQ